MVYIKMGALRSQFTGGYMGKFYRDAFFSWFALINLFCDTVLLPIVIGLICVVYGPQPPHKLMVFIALWMIVCAAFAAFSADSVIHRCIDEEQGNERNQTLRDLAQFARQNLWNATPIGIIYALLILILKRILLPLCKMVGTRSGL